IAWHSRHAATDIHSLSDLKIARRLIFLLILENDISIWVAAYSTDVCHPIHGKVATQSTGSLPPNPRERCHPVHGNAATWTTARLPPSPGEACPHRSSATPGLYCY